jgi:hypothetical protein
MLKLYKEEDLSVKFIGGADSQVFCIEVLDSISDIKYIGLLSSIYGAVRSSADMHSSEKLNANVARSFVESMKELNK